MTLCLSGDFAWVKMVEDLDNCKIFSLYGSSLDEQKDFGIPECREDSHGSLIYATWRWFVVVIPDSILF